MKSGTVAAVMTWVFVAGCAAVDDGRTRTNDAAKAKHAENLVRARDLADAERARLEARDHRLEEWVESEALGCETTLVESGCEDPPTEADVPWSARCRAECADAANNEVERIYETALSECIARYSPRQPVACRFELPRAAKRHLGDRSDECERTCSDKGYRVYALSHPAAPESPHYDTTPTNEQPAITARSPGLPQRAAVTPAPGPAAHGPPIYGGAPAPQPGGVALTPPGQFIPYAGNGRGPTVCNDGTVSHSAGRGTCSGHQNPGMRRRRPHKTR